MEFLRQHQLNIMLVLIGICGVVALFVLITNAFSRQRKQALFSLEMSAMLLLIFDRYAYIFRGDVSQLGYWMVRISNFCVFFFSLTILYAFNSYLIDLYRDEVKSKMPVRLKACKAIVVVGIISLILSQFTNFYYSFDAQNRYMRQDGMAVCYVFPFLILLLDFSVTIQLYKKLRRMICVSLMVFTVIPIIATFIQIFAYGVSLTNLACVGMSILHYILGLVDLNRTVEISKRREILFLKEGQKKMQTMFEQTATALANAIDAKDEYTHGHSMRVAEYSKTIAQKAGKDEEFCSEVYFAGLLHDVGKIGIPISIINKEGKLTDEEFAQIKKHPEIGRQILSSISSSPYLSIGANSHHERYDGRGYPEHLKGEDIPEIARIIAVADAYDAMTSKRSYRATIPQDMVREEIVKGLGTQFDPRFATIMLNMIDSDSEYQMKEKTQISEFGGKSTFECFEDRTSFSDGFLITPVVTKFKMRCSVQDGVSPDKSFSTMLVYDSLDGRVHYDDFMTEKMCYTEFAEIHFDGNAYQKEAREIKTDVIKKSASDINPEDFKKGIEFEGEAVKYRDHVKLQFNSIYISFSVTIALPDNSHSAYISLSGKQCKFSDVEFKKTEKVIGADYITRIARPVSYIDGPEGDIPSIQVDGWRTTSSKAFPIVDGMQVSFHAKGLPTSRLIWHCPYISLFYSDDKNPNGPNYMEFVCIRLDGENWEEGKNVAENSIIVNKNETFNGWPAWKELNKNGFDCILKFHRKGNEITVSTENGGIAIKSTTIIKIDVPDVYACLTGDQCVITNICCSKGF
ncbi:MAG: HD-GYP domain-containing protein [Treponema sp.]|nr:HD-GYP domain-containing protein [Treponema sp.]